MIDRRSGRRWTTSQAKKSSFSRISSGNWLESRPEITIGFGETLPQRSGIGGNARNLKNGLLRSAIRAPRAIEKAPPIKPTEDPLVYLAHGFRPRQQRRHPCRDICSCSIVCPRQSFPQERTWRQVNFRNRELRLVDAYLVTVGAVRRCTKPAGDPTLTQRVGPLGQPATAMAEAALIAARRAK